jgi:undecaprenyl diphosphate synthase
MHVAMIMDGNGRWATSRGRPRLVGHKEGVETLRRVVEAAPSLGVRVLTVYAFSSDNWARPRSEVRGLLSLFSRYLADDVRQLADRGVRLTFIGRRDRLPPALVRSMADAEKATAAGDVLHLRVAIDYSARDAILAAARRLVHEPSPTRDAFARALAADAPDVDLLIGPAANSVCPTSCCGSAPTRNSGSLPSRGPSSVRSNSRGR